MVQDNEEVDKWAFVIDDRASEMCPQMTQEEKIAYEKERDQILSTIDFDNL